MSDKVPRIYDKFVELYELGLWNPDIGLRDPNPNDFERIYNLEKDVYRRKYALSVPDDGDDLVMEARLQYYLDSLEGRKKIDKEKPERKEQISFKHLGKGVSGKLNHRKEDVDKLNKFNLPSIPDAISLSKFLDLEVNKITGLSYHRITATNSHYIDTQIPKKSGGFRLISIPKPYLKKIQYIIKEKILDKIILPDFITGFKKNTSIKDNANPHLNATFVINLDIKDFFPSIHYYRVRALFSRLGYSGEISSVLALLTTKQAQKEIKIQRTNHYVFSKHRYLPQGSPTSPIIANLVALPMDLRMLEFLQPLKFNYTRYADDLTLSSQLTKPKIRAGLRVAYRTIEMHGFLPNLKKTKVSDVNLRQEITGLTINNGKLGLRREWRRNLRAAIHNYIKTGDGNFASINSSLLYLSQFHPSIASILLNKLIVHFNN